MKRFCQSASPWGTSISTFYFITHPKFSKSEIAIENRSQILIGKTQLWMNWTKTWSNYWSHNSLPINVERKLAHFTRQISRTLRTLMQELFLVDQRFTGGPYKLDLAWHSPTDFGCKLKYHVEDLVWSEVMLLEIRTSPIIQLFPLQLEYAIYSIISFLVLS